MFRCGTSKYPHPLRCRLLACQQVTDRRYQIGHDAEVTEVVVEDEARIRNDLSGVPGIDHVAHVVHLAVKDGDRTCDGCDVERHTASTISQTVVGCVPHGVAVRTAHRASC